jgi:hypothetical protein
MVKCVECGYSLELVVDGQTSITYIPPELWADPDEPIKYMHFPKCSRAYFNKQTEDHIIRGEN